RTTVAGVTAWRSTIRSPADDRIVTAYRSAPSTADHLNSIPSARRTESGAGVTISNEAGEPSRSTAEISKPTPARHEAHDAGCDPTAARDSGSKVPSTYAAASVSPGWSVISICSFAA